MPHNSIATALRTVFVGEVRHPQQKQDFSVFNESAQRHSAPIIACQHVVAHRLSQLVIHSDRLLPIETLLQSFVNQRRE